MNPGINRGRGINRGNTVMSYRPAIVNSQDQRV